MSSFKEEVEKTRQMLENVNRRLTGTDDVVYFRPPIQIRLKKTNPNKSFKSFTSNYKQKHLINWSMIEKIYRICLQASRL